MRTASILDALCKLATKQCSLKAQELAHPLAAEGQDRRPQHREPVNSLQRNIETGSSRFWILLDALPRRFLVEILVHALAQTAHFGERSLKFHGIIQLAHCDKARADLVQQGLVCF